MALYNVNIYLETSISGPAVKEAAGVWWVECITGKPRPEFRKGFLWKGKTTENALTLELLVEALGILVRPCSIRVNTRCGLIINAMEKGWVKRWEKDGWANAKGRPVGHRELWQQAWGCLGKHVAGFGSWQNPYEEEMREGLGTVLGSRGQADPWKEERG